MLAGVFIWLPNNMSILYTLILLSYTCFYHEEFYQRIKQ